MLKYYLFLALNTGYLIKLINLLKYLGGGGSVFHSFQNTKLIHNEIAV